MLMAQLVLCVALLLWCRHGRCWGVLGNLALMCCATCGTHLYSKGDARVLDEALSIASFVLCICACHQSFAALPVPLHGSLWCERAGSVYRCLIQRLGCGAISKGALMPKLLLMAQRHIEDADRR